MEAILADLTISMSEFKKNPAAVLREAKRRPVAVLNHNKAAFYMIEPALIKKKGQGYRLVYGVQDDVLIVMVMAVDKREDSVVYQLAMARVSEKMAELAKAIKKRLEP